MSPEQNVQPHGGKYAGPIGFEPTTLALTGHCSTLELQTSMIIVVIAVEPEGIEPSTHWLKASYSTC